MEAITNHLCLPLFWLCLLLSLSLSQSREVFRLQPWGKKKKRKEKKRNPKYIKWSRTRARVFRTRSWTERWAGSEPTWRRRSSHRWNVVRASTSQPPTIPTSIPTRLTIDPLCSLLLPLVTATNVLLLLLLETTSSTSPPEILISIEVSLSLSLLLCLFHKKIQSLMGKKLMWRFMDWYCGSYFSAYILCFSSLGFLGILMELDGKEKKRKKVEFLWFFVSFLGYLVYFNGIKKGFSFYWLFFLHVEHRNDKNKNKKNKSYNYNSQSLYDRIWIC